MKKISTKKVVAKKSPAKMTMKKSSVKKAQNGMKVNPKVFEAMEKRATEEYGKKPLPVDVNRRIENKVEKQKQAEKDKKMIQEGGREEIKFMKEKGMGPSKQKNGGRTKK